MSATSMPPDDESRKQTAHPPKPRATKRVRANSDSSDIPDSVCMVVSHKVTPVGIPSRELSPARSEAATAPSEAGSEAASEVAPSEAGSTAAPNRQNKAIERIKRLESSGLELYKSFEEPVLEDAHPPKYHNFICKVCKGTAQRLIGHTTTSSLKYHLTAKCTGKPTTVLEDFGVIGPSKKPSASEVREVVALWVSESAWPFIIVNDNQFRRLLHPEDLIKTLAEVCRVFHIGLDMYQVANGIDILGVVLFHQFVTESCAMIIKRFVLECLNFEPEHTGVELAKGVYGILRKFQIADHVWAVVCDNASNNATMMDQLGGYSMKRLVGPAARSFCMLHVLNLAAQSALKPFRKTRKQLEAEKVMAEEEGNASEEDEHEVEQASDDKDIDAEDDGTAPSALLDCEDDEDGDEQEEELDDITIPEIVPGSPEAQEAERTYKVLIKLSQFSKKICFSCHTKTEFKAACVKEDLPKPHIIRRDMIIQWNATEIQLEDGDWTFPAIMLAQQSLGLPYHRRIKKEDRKVMQGLIKVLKPLRNVTEILSRAEVPLIADVIPHYDALTFEYDNMCTNKDNPLYLRHAVNRIRLKLNKHYRNTDKSELYRLGILLHPSLCVRYLRFAKWEDTWIKTAIEMAEEMWAEHYKPSAAATEATASAAATSQFAYSSYMDLMMADTNNDTEVEQHDCPVHEFVNANPIKDKSTKPHSLLNPITWWHGQRVSGNEHCGLTQMALDVLSAPATSVDVERAFSFVGSIVSKRHHSLAPCTVEAAATLGSYSKAGLVKQGVLTRVQAQAKAAKKAAASTADSSKKPAQQASK